MCAFEPPKRLLLVVLVAIAGHALASVPEEEVCPAGKVNAMKRQEEQLFNSTGAEYSCYCNLTEAEFDADTGSMSSYAMSTGCIGRDPALIVCGEHSGTHRTTATHNIVTNVSRTFVQNITNSYTTSSIPELVGKDFLVQFLSETEIVRDGDPKTNRRDLKCSAALDGEACAGCTVCQVAQGFQSAIDCSNLFVLKETCGDNEILDAMELDALLYCGPDFSDGDSAEQQPPTNGLNDDNKKPGLVAAVVFHGLAMILVHALPLL